MATKSKNIQTLRKGRNAVIDTVKNIHDKVLVVTDELIDLGVDTGSKYQKIASKAVKRSQPLMEKQMDIIFDGIQEMKEQYTQGNKRFLKLLGIEKQTKQWAKNISKKVKETKEQISETVQDIEEKISGTVQDIEEKITGNPVTDVKAMKASASKTVKKISTEVKKININKLSSINGIGPKLESILKEAGITNVNELIKTDVKSIKDILEKAGPRFSSYNPSEWINEAKKALQSK